MPRVVGSLHYHLGTSSLVQLVGETVLFKSEKTTEQNEDGYLDMMANFSPKEKCMPAEIWKQIISIQETAHILLVT